MEASHAARHRLPVGFERELSWLVHGALADGLAQLQNPAAATPDPTLRRKSQDGLERLWMRRQALVRALSLRTRPHMTPGKPVRGFKHWTLVDESTIELDIATAHGVRAVIDAAESEWRELQLGGEQAADMPTPAWPPAPARCVAAMRWAVEQASPEHAVRLELMRLGAAVLASRFAAACRRQLAGPHDLAPDAAPTAPRVSEAVIAVPAVPAPAAVCVKPPLKRVAVAEPTPPAPAPPTLTPKPTPKPEDLIEAARPGQWYRMVLLAQWADARLTWRSANGRFFMFSSQLAGRSHSISRESLERLIERGQFKSLDRASSGSARSGSAAAVKESGALAS